MADSDERNKIRQSHFIKRIVSIQPCAKQLKVSDFAGSCVTVELLSDKFITFVICIQ